MASEKELLSTEIVNRGVIEDSGPYAGSLSFLERVRRRLTRYSQICEAWLCLSAKPWHLLCSCTCSCCYFGCGLGKQLNWEDIYSKYPKGRIYRVSKKIQKFDEATIEYQQRVLKKFGMQDETYLPRIVFKHGHKINLRDGRDEAAMLTYGAIDQLLDATKICPNDMSVRN